MSAVSLTISERINRFLPVNHFARGVSILAGGTAAAQAIAILASPLLTRLYTPDDFGLLAVYASVLGIIGAVASLRYLRAIPLPESEAEAVHLLVLCLAIVAGMAVLTALVVLLFDEPIAAALGTPALAPYMWLLPVGMLLGGAYEVLSLWAIRVKAFPAIARTKLTQALGRAAVQLGGFMLGPFALLLGQVCGQSVGTARLGALAARQSRDQLRRLQLRRIWEVARRYKRFPLFSTWSGIFNRMGRHLPSLMFAVLFGPAVAGIYLLAQRILAMPLRLVGKAVADVFFSNAVGAHREGTLSPLVLKIYTKLGQLAMPPTLLLLFAGPQLFAFVFGDSWKQAGVFAQLMAPYLYLQFVTLPLGEITSVLEKQVHDLVFQGTLLAVRAASLIIGAVYFDVVVAVALYGAGSAVCWLVFLAWIFAASGNSLRAIWQVGVKTLAYALIPVSPVLAAYFLSGETHIFVLAAAAALPLLAVYTFFVFKDRAVRPAEAG